MSDKVIPNVAIVGNPNCGKTTVFNGLTGGKQRVGNWPGVTVEKKEGLLKGASREINLVDLPGIYSLSASSEDEKVARDYILSGESSLVIDIIDASNLERNLYLLTQLLEMKVPVLVVMNMMDLAEKKGLKIEISHMEKHLGCRVVDISALNKNGISDVLKAIEESVDSTAPSKVKISYPNEIEEIIESWEGKLNTTSDELGVNNRWTAIKLLEEDSWLTHKVIKNDDLAQEEINQKIHDIEKILGEDSDVLMADYKYAFISGIVKDTVKKKSNRISLTNKIDKVVMNKFLGIPIFLFSMFIVFWVTIHVGGAFIDFFDILFGTIFVDGFGALLSAMHAPEWLINLLAGGIGAGLQTVSTFVPIIFFMFFMLSILEDSGYMARAAFIMDRFMRSIGLPGKSFIPMIVGFGCTVPAIMATRTLESKKDRQMTTFMAPFMSCGARLPVYALFISAFFPVTGGTVLFSIYVTGIVLAILTGLMLKKTLFKGETSHFIMELPPYHAPRFRHILIHTWGKLKGFCIRGGKVITLAVAILGFLNSLGLNDEGKLSFGHEDSNQSALAIMGKSITPVFEPMGIEEDNWPATVGLFTGLFAKEAIVGTLNSIYNQNAAAQATEAEEGEEEGDFNFWAGIGEAFTSIPEAFAGLGGSVSDPFGTGVIASASDSEAVADEVGADLSTFDHMKSFFNKSGAFAYLLFILIYFPCFAALGAAVKELGKTLAVIHVSFLTVLGWSVATLYYQITAGGSGLWIVVSLSLIAAMVVYFRILGKRRVRVYGN